MSSVNPADAEKTKKSVIGSLKAWGASPLPPTLLATLITALHLRPFQTLPMLFPPMLLFSSYLNLAGFQSDAAGASAAWSALYVVLALRRRQRPLARKLGARGLVRGAAVGVGALNAVAGGIVFAAGDRAREREGVRKGEGRFARKKEG